MLCPSCGIENQQTSLEKCEKCGQPLAVSQEREWMQSIGQKRREDALKTQKKAAVTGAAIGLMAFHVIWKFEVELKSGGDFDAYRWVCAALAATIGGAIGRWMYRP